MRIEGCLFADDVLYDVETNVWLRVEEPDLAHVGITSTLAWLSGPLNSVTFKPVGRRIARGESLGSVEGYRHFDVVRSPVTCTLVEANLRLVSEPRLLNKDPYNEGWFAKVRLSETSRQQELVLLRNAQLAGADLAKRLEELRVHCFSEFPDLEMFEIGTECSAALRQLDEVLADSTSGTVVHLVSDDPTAEVEMIRWSDSTGNALLETKREGNLFHFIVRKKS